MVFNRLQVETEVEANAVQDFNKLRKIKGYEVKPIEEAWISNFYEDPRLGVTFIIDAGSMGRKTKETIE
ncbi:hypothetical protein GTO27_03275 [Candidatus Bathyarchaeota archaeon]|nr:hypothetical protein [Candidatus Bathyarchaeota archaeon]